MKNRIVASLLAFFLIASHATTAADPPPDWWRTAAVSRSKHFRVKSDLNPEDTQRLARNMDIAFDAYTAILSNLPGRVREPSRLHLCLFASQNDYKQTLSRRFRINGAASWGLHLPTENGSFLVAWKEDYSIDEMQQMLQHEGFHQVASHYFERLPTWADEGMAELFGRGALIGDRLALGEFSPRDKRRLLEAMEASRLVPLDQFLTSGDDDWNHFLRTRGADIRYLQAWSIAHFFVFGDHGKYQERFLAYVSRINAGVEPVQAFATSFGAPSFAKIEEKWIAHVRGARTSDYRAIARRLDFLAAGLKDLNQRGFNPTNLRDFQEELRDVQFEYVSELFGEREVISAKDENLFEVPRSKNDNEAGSGRQFVLHCPRRLATPRDNVATPPPSIYVQGDFPEAFVVVWKRHKRRFDYTIESGPAAREIIGDFEEKPR